MKKKLSVLVSLALTAMLALTGCASAKNETAEDSNVLKVGMEAGYPPFNWTQGDDSNKAVVNLRRKFRI